ncbi:MAG TPA: type II toxin-antitoxin system RelE/ParE family toxin [Verrucomicrobiae bacterium]|nr:type II toxin-antitoxin system RelE/ParE family toxin [Verrucomicrobiae bacterium]
MKYRFVDEALAEFIAAGRYYNQQVAGLGDGFVDEVEAGIKRILKEPEVWRVIKDDVRRYLIHRFPYGIYYTIEGDAIVIWAVKHLHRDPDYWQHRRRQDFTS